MALLVIRFWPALLALGLANSVALRLRDGSSLRLIHKWLWLLATMIPMLYAHLDYISAYPSYTNWWPQTDGDRRATIESELKALSEKYPGISAEKIALLRANYFMEKGLFGDAYQELFSVAKPSTELRKNLEEIKKAEFCPKKIVTQ